MNTQTSLDYGIPVFDNQTVLDFDPSNADPASALFLSLFAQLAPLDASISYGALDTLVEQGGSIHHGPMGQFNQQIAEAAAVPFARIGFMGTSSVNESALGHVMPQLTKAGDKSVVLLDSAAHTSLLAAIAISGQTVVWLNRRYDADLDVQNVPTACAIEAALRLNPAIETVAITSPDYNGCVADIAAISKVCERHKAFLYVDGAWGVGCGIIEGYPANPVTLGATAASVSFHKKGIGLSQTSCLYSRNAAFTTHYDSQSLDHFTTSPSYLALGFAQVMHTELTHGEVGDDWARIPDLHKSLAARTADIHPKIWVLGPQDSGAQTADPSHLLFYLGDIGISGFDMVSAMAQLGYDCEKGTFKTLLILLSPSLLGQEEALIKALHRSVKTCLNRKMVTNHQTLRAINPPVLKNSSVTIRNAKRGRSHNVPLKTACGHICAVSIAVYPPGTPILAPGSRIETSHLTYLYTMQRMGGHVSGIDMTTEEPVIAVLKPSLSAVP
ncbi:DegT/DnrJ/EryC1/StrS family aminotransferase [Fretibacter rubidus]|uniref:Orn/Lys/Arg family decarboxylase n=1 Tax=Fretibacter rubidus TaxID=570162 RepID=UPI00352ACA6E